MPSVDSHCHELSGVSLNHHTKLELLDAEFIENSSKSDIEHIETIKTNTTFDPVFGEINEDGPNYRNVGWVATAIIMIKTQIGIGALSIPGAFDLLGVIPGTLILAAVAGITTWSDYVVGCFKLKHPDVYGLDDAGYLMFGRVGKELFGGAFCLYYIFVAGSSILSISIGLNALSSHGACTAVLVAVAAVAAFGFSSIRTLSKISWLAAVGIVSILVSIFTVTIAVGVQDRPSAAPQTGPFVPDFKLVGNPSFAQAMQGVATIIFAFSGSPAFFPIAAEMKNPNHFTRSMIICQSTVFATYTIIGVIVYYFCGSFVTSPALGSAGPAMKKICYGLGLPGLLVTAMIVCHLPAKYVFVRILRGTRHMTSNTITHWVTWLACTSGVVITAYIIASAVPRFGSLVSLIGALLGTSICFQPMGCMWLYDNWTKDTQLRTLRWRCVACFAVFVIVSGMFCTIAGTYGAIIGLIDDYSGSGSASAWSCADNSNSE